MIRSYGVLILLFIAYPVFADTALEPLLIRISSVEAHPAVEPTLRSKSSSRFYRSCDAVIIDTANVSDALRQISKDVSLLQETPVRVELPSGRSETFFGKAGSTNKLAEGYSVHYRGVSKSEGVSDFSIGISPRGEVNAIIRIDRDEYLLSISNRLPTHFLCLSDPSFQPDM